MRIGELARRAAVPATAIRYYESEGLLAPPRRVAGRRDYDERAVARLRLVRTCLAAGFTIAETRAIVREASRSDRPFSEAFRRLAARKVDELASSIARLQQMRRFLRASLRCGCVRAEDCEWLVGG